MAHEEERHSPCQGECQAETEWDSDPLIAPLDPRAPEATHSVRLSPYVETQAGSAQQLAAAMHDFMARALALEGPKAFDSPKSSAALHEAGHCVVDALHGAIPTRATIRRLMEFGRPQWIGRTDGIPKWRVDDTTPADEDLQQARSQLAGVVAEILFDRANYRPASSADEIVTSQAIVRSAAIKMHRDPAALWLETLVETATILKANEKIVRRIADRLLRRGVIKSRQLARLLHEVRKTR